MPLGPAEYAIDFAASSAFLMELAELMSIFGAPARTATPTPERATSSRVSGMILPSLIRLIDLSRGKHDDIGNLAVSDTLRYLVDATPGRRDLISSRLLETRHQQGVGSAGARGADHFDFGCARDVDEHCGATRPASRRIALLDHDSSLFQPRHILPSHQ